MLGYTRSLYPGAKYASMFLSEVCKDLSIKPEVIFYIRHQPDFIESCFLQYFRENGPSKSFEDFWRHIDWENMSWNRVIKDCLAGFENPKPFLRDYKSIKNGASDFVQDFFSIFSNFIISNEEIPIVNAKFSKKSMDIYIEAYENLSKSESFEFQRLLKLAFPVSEKYPAIQFISNENILNLKEQYLQENTELTDQR